MNDAMIVQERDGRTRVAKSLRGVAVTRHEDGTVTRSDEGFELTLAANMTVREAASLLDLGA